MKQEDDTFTIEIASGGKRIFCNKRSVAHFTDTDLAEMVVGFLNNMSRGLEAIIEKEGHKAAIRQFEMFQKDVED